MHLDWIAGSSLEHYLPWVDCFSVLCHRLESGELLCRPTPCLRHSSDRGLSGAVSEVPRKSRSLLQGGCADTRRNDLYSCMGACWNRTLGTCAAFSFVMRMQRRRHISMTLCIIEWVVRPSVVAGHCRHCDNFATLTDCPLTLYNTLSQSSSAERSHHHHSSSPSSSPSSSYG